MKIRPSQLLIAPRARLLSESADEVRLVVDGLVCSICAGRVRSALVRRPGVESATCSLETGEAAVRLAPGAPQPSDWTAVVEAEVILPRLRRWIARAANG